MAHTEQIWPICFSMAGEKIMIFIFLKGLLKKKKGNRDHMWLAKPKIFITHPFVGKVCPLLSYSHGFTFHLYHDGDNAMITK